MSSLIQFGLDPGLLADQRLLADTLYIAFAGGKTPDDVYALLGKRGVRYTDTTRRIVEIAWSLWQEANGVGTQANKVGTAAVTVPVMEIAEP